MGNALAGAINPSQVVLGNSYIPSAAYAFGTFSNGPVWASDGASDFFNSLLGLDECTHPMSTAG